MKSDAQKTDASANREMADSRNTELDQILDAIPDLVMVLDSAHRIVRANRAVMERYGGDVVGHKCFEIVHGTERPVAGCPHAALLRDGREHVAEVTENRLGDTFIVSASPLHGVDTNIRGCVHIARDITARKRAEKAARASHHLLERTFAALGDAVFAVDPCTRVVTACNDAVQAIFGYRTDEVVGRNTEFLHVDRDMYARFGRELFPALDAHGIFRTSFKMRRKDGTLFDSEHTVTEIRDRTGARVGVVSVVRDVSEQKAMQEALRESEQRFRMTLENTKIIVAHADTELRYLWIYNPHPDFEFQSLIGKRDSEVAQNAGTEQLEALKRRVLKNERGARDIITFPVSDGPQTYDITAEPMRDAEGRTIGVTTAALNITQKEISEKVSRIQHELAMGLAGVRSLPETLRLSLDAAIRVSGMDCGAIYLVETGGGLRLAHSAGLSGDFTAAAGHYPADAPNTRLVMKGGAIYARHRDLDVPLSEAERNEALAALAVIPVRHQERIIGCINVASHGLEQVSPDRRVALETIAYTIGLLITRAQAAAETERLASFPMFNPNPVLEADAAGTVTYVNPAARNVLDHLEIDEADVFLPGDWIGLLDALHKEPDVPLSRRIRIGDRLFEERICRVSGSDAVRIYASDITEREHAMAAMERLSKELRLLHGRIAALQETERRQLARDLHDNIGTDLSALGIGLRMAGMKAEDGDTAAAAAAIERLERQAEHITQQVRHFISELRPGVLDDYGLAAAVRGLCERVAGHAGISIRIHGDLEERFPQQLESTLYRIVQEALANCVKHAGSERVDVTLGQVSGVLWISVRDDGCGFDPGLTPGPTMDSGMGLIDMRERAASVGAVFRLESAPGQGTEVIVEARLEDYHC